MPEISGLGLSRFSQPGHVIALQLDKDVACVAPIQAPADRHEKNLQDFVLRGRVRFEGFGGLT